jgi:hypothetical protein
MNADWSRKFDEPILLPNGRKLATLKDAGEYITKLPAAEHSATEWQTAMQALMLVATAGHGPTMLARIGIMKALSRNVPQTLNETPSKKTHCGKRKLARDRE